MEVENFPQHFLPSLAGRRTGIHLLAGLELGVIPVLSVERDRERDLVRSRSIPTQNVRLEVWIARYAPNDNRTEKWTFGVP